MTNTGTIPVKRKQDHHHQNIDNKEAFDALFKSLAKNSCVGLFPEGISRWHSQMAPLKSGVARIAISFVREQIANGVVDPHVWISPCGITYLHRAKFRTSVLVNYGDPLRIDSSMLGEANNESDHNLSLRITEEIQKRLLGLTISSPTWEISRLAFLCAQIQRGSDAPLVPLADYVGHARSWNNVLMQHTDGVNADPAGISSSSNNNSNSTSSSDKDTITEGTVDASKSKLLADLFRLAKEYQQLLSKVGINDYRVATRPSSSLDIIRRIIIRLLSVSALLSIALPGTLLSAPMIIAWRIQEEIQFKKTGGLEKNYDEVAMYKLLYQFTFLPILNVIYTLLVGYYYGFKAGSAFFVCFLPFLWLTVRWFEDGMSSLRALRSLAKYFTHSKQIDQLREKRAVLASMVSSAAAAFGVESPKAVYDSGSFFSLLGRRHKHWNESLRPFELEIGD